MGALEFLKSVFDDQALGHSDFRNALLIGNFDERRFINLLKRSGLQASIFKNANTITSAAEFARIVTAEIPNGIIIFSEIDKIKQDIIEIALLVFQQRKLDIINQKNGKSYSMRIDLEDFRLICSAESIASIPAEIRDSFDVAMLFGSSAVAGAAEVRLASGNDACAPEISRPSHGYDYA